MKKFELWQGDCLELMKKIPDGSVDLTVTSPPYDNLRTYNGNIEQWNFEKFKSIAKELTVTEFVEDELPAADVAPVVHCKDCKHLMFSDCYGECGKGHMGIVSPDDFCSYGERR